MRLTKIATWYDWVKDQEISKYQSHSALTSPLTHLFHEHSFSAIPSKVKTHPVEKVLWYRQIRNQQVKHLSSGVADKAFKQSNRCEEANSHRVSCQQQSLISYHKTYLTFSIFFSSSGISFLAVS